MGKLTLALVAHDHKKPELLAWVKQHIDVLKQCNLVGTGTTGGLIANETGLEVTRYKSGPLGGDQQIGALIAENKLDALFFFWDPLNPVRPRPFSQRRNCSRHKKRSRFPAYRWSALLPNGTRNNQRPHGPENRLPR